MGMNASDQLRKAIETCGESRYAIAKATGLEQSTLSRFMAGRSINSDVVDALATYFKLSLAPAKTSRRKTGDK
jgi:hypothetical protein